MALYDELSLFLIFERHHGAVKLNLQTFQLNRGNFLTQDWLSNNGTADTGIFYMDAVACATIVI